MATSYYVGVLSRAHGWQKGRKSGGSCSLQLVSWRVSISSIPKPAVIGFEMKPPDASLDDQAIRDRQRSTSLKDEGGLFQVFEEEDEIVRWSFPS